MERTDHKQLTFLIRERALDLGFDLFGIAPSHPMKEHGKVIAEWCNLGMNADMSYLGRDIEKRVNPDILFPGAKSVIVTGLSYFNEKCQGGNGIPEISRYAYGKNYHDVIKRKLDDLLDLIIKTSPGYRGRSFVDSAPIVEKAWAREAGLGWPGRHSILINKKLGSFFFLGIIITDLDLEYNKPYPEENCGVCNLCIESCPTGAINSNRTIDARRCIAYLTVESKEPVKGEILNKMNGRIFGCDICQEVCPWNKDALHHKTPEFEPAREMIVMSENEWQDLTEDSFKRLFKKTAVGRKKFDIFKQNVTNVTKEGRID